MITTTTPQKLIKHLADLARDIREQTQNLYAAGKQDIAMEAVSYVEGIERAMVEIAALNSIEMRQIEELRSFDLDACRARFLPMPLRLSEGAPPEISSTKHNGLKPENGHTRLRQRSSRFHQTELR